MSPYGGLAGVSAAVTGLVTRGVDKAVIQGGQVLLPQTQEDPVTVHASQLQGRQGYVGPVPPARGERLDPINRVDLFTSIIHLIIEAAGDQTAIVTRLDVRLESCDAPPRISYTVPYIVRPAAPMDHAGRGPIGGVGHHANASAAITSTRSTSLPSPTSQCEARSSGLAAMMEACQSQGPQPS